MLITIKKRKYNLKNNQFYSKIWHKYYKNKLNFKLRSNLKVSKQLNQNLLLKNLDLIKIINFSKIESSLSNLKQKNNIYTISTLNFFYVKSLFLNRLNLKKQFFYFIKDILKYIGESNLKNWKFNFYLLINLPVNLEIEKLLLDTHNQKISLFFSKGHVIDTGSLNVKILFFKWNNLNFLHLLSLYFFNSFFCFTNINYEGSFLYNKLTILKNTITLKITKDFLFYLWLYFSPRRYLMTTWLKIKWQ
jgi:hypothetical protein